MLRPPPSQSLPSVAAGLILCCHHHRCLWLSAHSSGGANISRWVLSSGGPSINRRCRPECQTMNAVTACCRWHHPSLSLVSYSVVVETVLLASGKTLLPLSIVCRLMPTRQSADAVTAHRGRHAIADATAGGVRTASRADQSGDHC